MPEIRVDDLAEVRVAAGEPTVSLMWSKRPSEGPAKAPRRGGRRFSFDPRGQGLVEFAITFPVVMLMITFGVDFGRVFLGWVTLNNAVRVGANYAAMNPDGFQSPVNLTVQAEYRRLVLAETRGINCTMPNTLPYPTYPAGTELGDPAVVAITCRFSLITPIIGNILGSAINVSASASFPVRAGSIDGTPIGPGLPSFAATPTVDPGGGGGPGSSTDPGGSSAPGSSSPPATPIPTPSPIITPEPNCTVPNLVDVQTTQALSRWTAAGFSANHLAFNPLVPPNYKIRNQTQTAGFSIPCSSSMTVSP
jgi:hypothetical protein